MTSGVEVTARIEQPGPVDAGPVRGLVLAGGGLKVAFQAGVLQVLLDEARTPNGESLGFPIADGASGGAFNLALLSQGLTGREIADRWRRTRPIEGVSLNWRGWFPRPISLFTYNGFRRRVLRRTWQLDWDLISSTNLRTSFNMFDFDEQRHQTWSAAQMSEEALVAAVSLPMWFPPVPLDRGGRRHNYIDAVFATNANLEAAIAAGATELWVIWTENQRGRYRRGFTHTYFQMIEAVANSRIRAVVERIVRSNAAGNCGEFGRPITIRWLSAEVPAHYLFSLSRTSIAEAVDRGVVEGRKWCLSQGLTIEPTTPTFTAGEVSFRERMTGAFTFGPCDPAEGAAAAKGTDTALTARLEVIIDEVDRFVAEQMHRGRLSGHISSPVFGGRQTLIDGTVSLLWDDGDPTHKRLSYRLCFLDGDDQAVTVFGMKFVVNDRGFDMWSDTTKLYIHLYRGQFGDDDRPRLHDLIGCGMLTISLAAFCYQLTTFRSRPGKSVGRVRTLLRFARFFLRQLWHVYGQPPGPERPPLYRPPTPPALL